MIHINCEEMLLLNEIMTISYSCFISIEKNDGFVNQCDCYRIRLQIFLRILIL